MVQLGSQRSILIPVILTAILAAGCGSGTLDKSSGAQSSSGSQNLWSSSRPGMGAVPYDTGTTFRVWAPNAYKIFLAGDFNGWQPTEMGNEFNGNFSLDVDGAHPGQKYKFQIQQGGNTFWRTDPRAQECENSAGNSTIHERGFFTWQHDQDFKFPPTNQQVVYEMHIGTYDDSPGFGPGTWQSAIAKLDHLKDLGINVVEVMPVSEFAGDFSMGYNPAVPFAPETAYGSPGDMKSFVDNAHGRGIAVVLDVVYNHFGSSDIQYDLWDFDGPDYGHGGIFFNGTTDWGPAPDFGRQEVKDYLRDNALQWVNEYHVDGLRMDAVYAMRGGSDGYNAVKEVVDAVHSSGVSPKFLIAEDMQDDPSVTDGNGLNFDAQWDAVSIHGIRDTVTATSDGSRNLGTIAAAITHNFNGDPFHRVVYTESHDEVSKTNGKQRVPTQIGGWDSGGYFAEKLSTLGAAVVLTSPARPMLFEGQEFLTPGQWEDGVPLDWSLSSTYSGIQQMYTDLIHLRRDWNGNTGGLRGANVNVFHRNDSDKVLAYHRWDQGGPGDDVVVVANFSNTTFSSYQVGFPQGGTWHVRFNSDWKGYSSNFAGTQTFDLSANGAGQDGMGQSGSFALGPYSMVVFSQ